MLALNVPPPKQRRQGYVLPLEYVLGLRIVTGWSQRQIAELADVSPAGFWRWEKGHHRLQGAAWRLLLKYADLPSNWRPSSDVCRLATRMIEEGIHDVPALERELMRTERAEEPIVAWRRKQAAEAALQRPGPIVERASVPRRKGRAIPPARPVDPKRAR